MMKLVDLTRMLDAADLERIPEAARAAASVLVPTIDAIRPEDRGAEIMCALFGCEKGDLPDGEGWGDEALCFSSHLGTQVDAPLHYGSTCEGAPARSITDIALGVLLRTGQERFGIEDPELYNYPGMTREGTLFLANLGTKVVGTDAVGWDRPFLDGSASRKEPI